LADVAAPAAASGSIGLRLLDAPADARDDPRALIYIVDHLAPGTVIHRRVEVSNSTAKTADVVLYAAEAGIARGSFLASAGHSQNDLATWTTVRPGTVRIPAGGRATAAVTVSVPTDAPPGEQYGVVWAEVRSAPPTGGGIVQVSRVGLRLYVSVGPGGPPAAGFTITSLAAERSPEGRPVVAAVVRNTGGRALDMDGTLELASGPGGVSAGPFPASLGTTLAIGDTGRVTINLDDQLPSGPWDARITLRSGLLEHSARATLTFPDVGAAPAVATTPGRSLRRYLALAALLILLIIGGRLPKARLGTARRHASPHAGPEATRA
jgi:hypothetical protein